MNLLCVKIWLGRNVVWLLNYYRMWLDFEIDEVWERKLREKGERQKNREKVSWEKEENECWGEGGCCFLFFSTAVTLSPPQKKNRPRKLAYQERLGYDYLLFYFFPQVESHHMKFCNTLTMLMFLPWSYFSWEPKILTNSREIFYLTKLDIRVCCLLYTSPSPRD